ncbi:Ppx/GppA phosphatase family protein [Mariniblastus fucicola]|nr:HD domain-containing protein [Mariniblastus fucicola]
MVAVIDVGASSLRMQIAEIRYDGSIRKLESFSQALSLGKDSFSTGVIARDTIENCVHVLSIYRAKLDEYEITDPDNIRVIATSGVNEASNRLAFLDRIYVATGFEINSFDEAELHRITYRGIQPYIKSAPKYFKGETLAVEVGGGTTEALWLSNGNVAFARAYRLGALRMRQRLELYDAPLAKARELMERQIRDTIVLLKDSVPDTMDSLIAMGGDIRFAASEIKQSTIGNELVDIKLKALERFVNEVLESSPEHIVMRHHMSLPDAQLLGPGLLTVATFARAWGIDKITVANVNLRDGMISEMAKGRMWNPSIGEQILRGATQLGRKYHFNEAHSIHVAKLTSMLFDQLQPLHGMSGRFRGLLQVAAILHQVGSFISNKGSHKHSMYIIENSEFFGIGSEDKRIVALVARYHRRAMPSSRHIGYSSLSRDLRVAVSKMSSILRLAIALNASNTQRIDSIKCKMLPHEIQLVTEDMSDLSLERMELRQAGRLFESIFGKPVVLTSTSI